MDAFGAIASIIGSGISAGANYGINAMNNREAANREQAARESNYYFNELAAENAHARTKNLYTTQYSPQAQLEQLKTAGLSPSLFYGVGGGISGQTGAMGAGASGVAPNTYGMSPVDFSGIAKTMAEIGLIKAQTRKTNEEANTEAGQNERGKAEIQNIVENTNNVLLKNVYQEYENALEQIQLGISAATAEEQVKNYFKQTEYLEYAVTSAKVKAEIDEKSENDVLAYIKERTNNMIADTVLKQAQTELTKEQVIDLVNQITVRDKQIKLNEKTLREQINQWGKENNLKQQEIDTMFDAMVVNGVVGGASNILNLLKFSQGLRGGKVIKGLQ